MTSNGNLIKNNKSVILFKEACHYCGVEYITYKQHASNYCSNSCSKKGKVFSDAHKVKLSIAQSKGGVSKLNLPLYETYSSRIAFAEETRFLIDNENRKLLEVRCTKCSKWYVPTRKSVDHRIGGLYGMGSGENRFYCSQKCKDVCEIFNKKPKHFYTISTNLPIYTEQEIRIWSEEVRRRAHYKCEFCGKEAVHAHHIEPKALEPGLALDLDNGVACCVECHYKYGHIDECTINNIKERKRECQH